jgi:DNA-binding NarL/FixJ family response regulator
MSFNIVIADDHALVRAGLRELLLTISNVNVVGEVGNGMEAIDMCQEKQPDIVILDIAMPKMRGLEAIKEIKRFSPDSRILIISMYDKQDYVREALKNGAKGYLLKEAAAEELKIAIQTLIEGEVYVSPALSKTIIAGWIRGEGNTFVKSHKGSELTERELMVVKLLCEGYTNRKVAETLHISTKTVETHRHRIMDKLNLDSFAGLVKYAVREGIVEV